MRVLKNFCAEMQILGFVYNCKNQVRNRKYVFFFFLMEEKRLFGSWVTTQSYSELQCNKKCQKGILSKNCVHLTSRIYAIGQYFRQRLQKVQAWIEKIICTTKKLRNTEGWHTFLRVILNRPIQSLIQNSAISQLKRSDAFLNNLPLITKKH